jgi:hypothetical protein
MEARILRLESEVYRLRADAESRSRDLRMHAEADLRRVRSDMESEVCRLRAEVDALKFKTEPMKTVETVCLAVSLFIIALVLAGLVAGVGAA